MSAGAWRAANLANWNERVTVHAASRTYDLDGFVADPQRLSGVVAFDAPRVGDLRGRRLLHLQCHIGTDTLSWARLGAEVTGLDFSGPALDVARDVAARAGLRARFVEADVDGAVAALEGETFDVVYTSVGALCWLPDVRRWAEVVAALLAPGGRLHVRDTHPIVAAMDDTADHLVFRYPYFGGEPLIFDETSTYTDGDVTLSSARTYEWIHGLGEIVSAVVDAGLTVTALAEHRHLDFAFWDWMEPVGDGTYVLPAPLRDLVPLQFSLSATKEAAT